MVVRNIGYADCDGVVIRAGVGILVVGRQVVVVERLVAGYNVSDADGRGVVVSARVVLVVVVVVTII